MDLKQGFRSPPAHFATNSIHGGRDVIPWPDGEVVTPIALTTIFRQDPDGPNRFVYGRVGNPTRAVLEGRLASIEGSKYGVAAITAVIHLLNCGDHWIVHDDLYPGVIKELRDMALKMGIETTFVDARYCDRIRAAMQPNTRLVWIEPITNPLLNLVDVEAVARVVQEKEGCVFAVDNTFLTGYFLRPLEFGATLVIYSATKYLNGHNDVTLGYVALNDDAMYEALWNIQQGAGSVPSPFECYLLLRSLKTLPIRMEKHMTNGLAVARYLQAEPHVEKVIHPGLDDYSSSALLRHQCSGYSGMVAFYLRGCAEDAHRFVTSLRVVSNADSLGGCESTAKIPACLGTSYTPEEAALRGITPNLVRMSVGLEDPKDIIADLDQALKSTLTEM
ncbi:unnamed protein product [Cyprideis torosa]|uniref:cystathionine gamma-lyase n=1 Tax=Cyprideis torosa TaxID=163714 RepID=A0A7R8W5A9_9CRUS|nr:unnamed protein product [Cyprideis torosa]CAG0885069.1 unnamed protein product [Cyprideis torosa]